MKEVMKVTKRAAWAWAVINTLYSIINFWTGGSGMYQNGILR
jgi:hypothetical protein